MASMLSIRLPTCVSPWRYFNTPAVRPDFQRRDAHARQPFVRDRAICRDDAYAAAAPRRRARADSAVLPPFHIYALTVNMLHGYAHRRRADPAHPVPTRLQWSRTFREKKVTVFPGVPTMYVAIINHPGVENLDLSSIKWCASGGALFPWRCRSAFRIFPAAGWPRAGA